MSDDNLKKMNTTQNIANMLQVLGNANLLQYFNQNELELMMKAVKSHLVSSSIEIAKDKEQNSIEFDFSHIKL